MKCRENCKCGVGDHDLKKKYHTIERKPKPTLLPKCEKCHKIPLHCKCEDNELNK